MDLSVSWMQNLADGNHLEHIKDRRDSGGVLPACVKLCGSLGFKSFSFLFPQGQTTQITALIPQK